MLVMRRSILKHISKIDDVVFLNRGGRLCLLLYMSRNRLKIIRTTFFIPFPAVVSGIVCNGPVARLG